MTRKKLTLTDLLQLLLGADVGGVAARLLAAVGGARVQARVALPEQEQKYLEKEKNACIKTSDDLIARWLFNCKVIR